MPLPRLNDDIFIPKTSKAKNQQAIRFSNLSYLNALNSPNTPQAVIKVLKTARHNKVKDLLNYIARQNDKDKENVELETSDGLILQDKEEIKELYDDWKVDFQRKKKNTKTAPRHATHMIFSADCQQKRKNILKLQDCVRDLAARNFNGYEYAFGIHQDGKNPHVHLVVKCKSREKGVRKLRIDPGTLFQLRQEFAEELTKRGLSHCSTLFKDRPNTIKEKLFPKAPQKTWFQVKLKDILQETALITIKYNKIEKSLKNADNAKKEKLYKKRDAIGERVNQLKRNISERTIQDTVQRSQSFNIVRKLERELKRRDPAFRNILKRADQLNPKTSQDIKLKANQTPSHLKEALKNLDESFSKIENPSLKTKPSAYKDEVKFIGEQVNQLKINVKLNTKEDSKERLNSFNAIRKLERDLKKRDPRFKKIIKMTGHLKTDTKESKSTPEKLQNAIKTLEKKVLQLQTQGNFKTSNNPYIVDERKLIGKQINQLKQNISLNTKPGSKEHTEGIKAIKKLEQGLAKRDQDLKNNTKQTNTKKFNISKSSSDHIAKNLIEAKKSIKNLPAKDKREAKKLLAKYTKVITKSSPQIKRSFKNIKRKERGFNF